MNKTTSGEENSHLIDDNEDLQPAKIKDENAEAKKKQRMKCIAISIGIAVAIAVLIVILVLVLKKSSGPEPTPDVNPGNPFKVTGIDNTTEAHTIQKYLLSRDTSITTADGLAKGGNTYLDKLTLDAQLLSYQTARIRIFESDKFHESYHVPTDFFDKDILKKYHEGLRFNHLGFQTGIGSTFFMRLFDRNTKEDFVTTAGEPFLIMKYYTTIGFKLESQKLFGLGERTRNFKLDEGTYVMYPFNSGSVVDDGKSINTEAKQQMGQHPFLMSQLREGLFFGIYIANSNPSKAVIKYSQETVKGADGKDVTKYFSHVVFTSNAGSLDVHFFLGPSYQNVLRQYHSVIGKPRLPSLMAQGLYISNDDVYKNFDDLNTILKYFNTNQIPLEGAVITPLVVDSQYSWTLKKYGKYIQLKDLQNDFTGLKWIFPWAPHISKDYHSTTFTDKNLVLTVKDKPVSIVDSVKKDGYCFDYFNPNATAFLDDAFNNVNKAITGMWLYHNLPTVDSTTQEDSNPFADLPVWPGNSKGFPNTIPAFAQSHIGYDQTTGKMTYEYMYNLHGLYGSQMAKQIQYSLSDHDKHEGLIISENTFPGIGARAIAHVLPKTGLSQQELKYAVSGLFNFHMFGVPLTSHNVCGFTRAAFTADLANLCVKSFQLAVVSPMAIYNTDGQDINALDAIDLKYTQAIKSNLNMRLRLMMYQRSELYKIENVGGALIRPLFTEYPNLGDIYTPDTLDTLMFGEALKVDFQFDPAKFNKDVFLPEQSLWLEIVHRKLYIPDAQTKSITVTTGLNYPVILQKEGTIIPIQDVDLQKGITTTNSLKNIPMDLSILLDQADYIAKGHVLIEDNQGQQQHFEVRATIDSIGFKQQNAGAVDSTYQSRKINSIRVAAKATTFIGATYKACAVLQDHHTVQELKIELHTFELEITPVAPDTLAIDNIAFIYYGTPKSGDTFVCDQTLLQGKVKLEVSKDAYSAEYVISQNIKDLVSWTPDLNFQISLTDDNSLELSLHEHVEPQTEASRTLFSEKIPFQGKKNLMEPTYKLDTIVTINQNPFYIEVHSYQAVSTDPKTVYWTTKDTSFIFHTDYAMFSFVQPGANPDRFFGIGERKGEFYLQDNYQYSMYNNNHNLDDITQGTRTVQFCKNGFFPIIFAIDANSNNKMMATMLGEGSKDVFFNSRFGKQQVPKVSIVQSLNYVYMKLIFDQEPLALMKDLHRNFLAPEQQRIPPAWALGQYHLVRNYKSSQDLIDQSHFYGTIKWPLEGYLLDLNFTGFESLYLSDDRFDHGHANFTLDYLNQKNLKIFNIMKAGIPKYSTQANYLIGNNSAIVRESYFVLTPSPIVGLDQQGEVIYANYYKNMKVLSDYFEGAMAHYERTFESHTYGIQLINNEIYEPFCTNDCFLDSQFDPMPGHFYKVGTDQMLRNSMSGNSVKNVDTHNGYAYRQHIRLSHADFKRKTFFISSSTTASSGRYGNIGRLIDYITFKDDPSASVVALQSLSLMGMGAIGEKFGSVVEKVGAKTVNQHIMIQTFSPLAAHQWLQAYDQDDINAGPLVRFKYMMIKYTQAMLFRQAKYGDPLIHPLFLDFYNDASTFSTDVINNQYMYGDFIVSIMAQTGSGTYYPKGTWCSTANYVKQHDALCFTSSGGYRQIQTPMFFFKEGSIVPLQDAHGLVYNKPLVNTTDDLLSIPIDLHLNPKVDDVQELFFSKGIMLYTNDTDDDLPSCYVEISHNGNKISFDLKGSDINECKYGGYALGRLYIYNIAKFPYTNAKLNDAGNLRALQNGNQYYKYFDFSDFNLSWYDVYTIQFS